MDKAVIWLVVLACVAGFGAVALDAETRPGLARALLAVAVGCAIAALALLVVVELTT